MNDPLKICRPPLVFFYPTRFHIFDQLMPHVLERPGEAIELYSIYPPRFFRTGRFASLGPYNRTLITGLALKALIRVGDVVGLRGAPARALRSLYISGAAAEFVWRQRRKGPRVIVASAGYLGRGIDALQRAGHLVVINHGSLYEPAVRARLEATLHQKLGRGVANWTHSGLIARMDAEFNAADAIVVCSPTARDSFPRRLRSKISIVPLGAPAISDLIASPHALAEKTGAGTTFLHISNLSIIKNVTRILEAFNKIREPEDRLLIGGPPPEDKVLRQRLFRSDPGVVWLGRLKQSEVIKTMSESDIFVHPSLADGWAMAVTEALASGLPVVSSFFTGAASYYAQYADVGDEAVLLVDPCDTDALAEAMNEMRKRSQDNRQRIVTPESWKSSASVLRGVLEPLLESISES